MKRKTKKERDRLEACIPDWFLMSKWCVVIAVKEVNKGVRTNRTGHFPTVGHRPMNHRMTYNSAWSDGPYQPRLAKKVPQTPKTDFVHFWVPSGLALSH